MDKNMFTSFPGASFEDFCKKWDEHYKTRHINENLPYASLEYAYCPWCQSLLVCNPEEAEEEEAVEETNESS